MSTPDNTDEPRALFSEDGKSWANDSGNGPVVKIVIGTPPREGEEGKAIRLLDEQSKKVWDDVERHLPTVTHLYLWQIEDLDTLPTLPPHLQCLDLRGCTGLKQLPALPPALETLDFGGCTGLSQLPVQALPSLERLYLNGCVGLKAHTLAAFLEALRDSPIVELDVSEVPTVTSLDECPRRVLRKLVLIGCPKLTDVRLLGEFPALEHVNLGGCTALESLPALPPRLRFLVLHGANNLTSFLGQDIGPYDRGSEKQNVAKAFLSREKFGKKLAIMPHAKLLMMGDGRVGKTTLAKRLQWEEVPEGDRRTHEMELKPSRSESFTHKVCFWRWETGLSLPDRDLRALEERAAAAQLTLPKTQAGLLDGAVRIWDFGGQEIYHHTHRIFAGEGSIFLLVWRQHEPEAGASPAKQVSQEEWEEWNRQRPLDYWLDYIYSMRPQAQVALVCTKCSNPDAMPVKPDWKVRAPKHAHLDLPSFFVDSLDDSCAGQREYQRLVRWIREACGREALRIGILQPRFYRVVSDLLDRWLRENSQARLDDRRPKHLLYPWQQWEDSVRAAYNRPDDASSAGLDEDDVVAITDYLHEAGHLFQIRQEPHRAVLVDQEWAAELIYRLLECRGHLRAVVKSNGGWFYRADLENDDHWKALEDWERSRLLAYMEECQVITRLAQANRQRLNQDLFLASDKWLLPEYEGRVEQRVDNLMRLVREQPSMEWRERFEFEAVKLSEFDFRALQALLARTFGIRGIYFRTGFQAQENDNVPDWCFRMRWVPEEKDPFVGKVDAVLIARRRQIESLGGEIEDLFYADGSPLANRRRRLVRSEPQPRDLGHEYFRDLRQDEYDLGVSSSGADKAEAEALVGALQTAGFNVNWYRIDSCRADDRAGVLDFMNRLGRQQCIVLVVSEDYLHADPVNNWYCAWELADAIRRLAKRERTREQTLVVFKQSDGFQFAQFDQVAFQLLKAMAVHFHKAYGDLSPADAESFRHYDDFRQLFVDATKRETWNKFILARGSLGSAISFDSLPMDATGNRNFSRVIQAVERATGRKARA